MTISRARVFVFAFGTKEHQASQWLAKEAQAFARAQCFGIDTQPDITINPNFGDVWYIPEEPNTPSPTLRMARAFVQRAKEKNVKFVFVFSAQPHEWRVMRDLRKANKEAGIPISEFVIPDVVRKNSNREWFDPNSKQIHTRTKRNWLKRDILLWLMPFFIYKRIAS